jgi:hypothetical protein
LQNDIRGLGPGRSARSEKRDGEDEVKGARQVYIARFNAVSRASACAQRRSGSPSFHMRRRSRTPDRMADVAGRFVGAPELVPRRTVTRRRVGIEQRAFTTASSWDGLARLPVVDETACRLVAQNSRAARLGPKLCAQASRAPPCSRPTHARSERSRRGRRR